MHCNFKIFVSILPFDLNFTFRTQFFSKIWNECCFRVEISHGLVRILNSFDYRFGVNSIDFRLYLIKKTFIKAWHFYSNTLAKSRAIVFCRYSVIFRIFREFRFSENIEIDAILAFSVSIVFFCHFFVFNLQLFNFRTQSGLEI